MSDTSFQKAVLEAREAFTQEFLARVPSYTGLSRAQLDSLTVRAEGFSVVFSVPHFLYNEKFNANLHGFNLTAPGPYNAIPAARAAAEKVLADEFTRKLKAIVGRLAWLNK